MSYHSLRTPREAITEIVRHAPPEVRPAIIALIRAAYRSLKRGYQPDKQTRTQSPQRIHLLGSRTRAGELVSRGRISLVFWKRTVVIFIL